MRELQQVTTTVPDAAKRCRFYRVELLNGGKYRTKGGKCRQIAGNGAKMAGAARVGKWRSKSKAGGKYLLNKCGQNSEAINKNFPKYPKMPKNGNAVFVGDFRRFAAGDVPYLRRRSYVL